MPLKKGKKNVGANIRELHSGKAYSKTKRKSGKKKADKQAVAIAMDWSTRKKKKRGKKK